VSEDGDGLDPREPSASSVVYRREAVIAAEPARIWQLLVDLPGYSGWNPWIVRAEGDVSRGGKVSVDVILFGVKVPAEHIVLAVEPEHRFCWKDTGWNGAFVYSQRCRTLTRNPDGTVLLSQELLMEGLLSPVAGAAMGKNLSEGMAAETDALKRRAEQPAG
jgi:uncharacterized protein YndB with AHSA1/START domain